MKLISINVAKPKTIEHQGKQITTGIFKQPSATPVFVGKYNLQGDRQADLKNHGGEHKAVYAFAAEHYPIWAKALNQPLIAHGAFGENLTISGFDEAAIHIGDQFRIGQCILELTQPRVPCYKLSIALGDKNMARMFIESFATGAYLRVLREGFIEPNDPVEIIQQNRHRLSVQTLFKAYFDKTFTDSERILEQALLIPQLSDEWRKKVVGRLEA